MGTHYGYRPSGNGPYVNNTVVSDPQFNYVTMLLHGDGTNGSQNNTFVDSSTNNFTITRNGNTTQGSLSPYGSLWSNYFDGSGDYLGASSNAALALPGAFTFECWFYPNSFDQVSVIGDTIFSCIAVGSLTIARTSSTAGNAWGIAETGVAWRLTSTTLPTNNTWNHLVAVRDASNNAALFLNGVRVASGSLTTSFPQNGFSLGSDNGSANSFLDGYLSNVRLVKGTAVYSPTSTTLTVPTAPLTAISGTSLLTCQSNRFIDNSANNFTITRNGDVRVTKESPFLPTAAYSTSTIGGSGYFDGNGDWLEIANNAAFQFGSSDFSVEAWVYLTAVGTVQIIVGKNSGTYPTGYEFALFVNSDNSVGFNTYTTTFVGAMTSANFVTTGQWYHIVGCRSGGTQSLFLNGVRVASTANTGTIQTTTSVVTVGRDYEAVTPIRYVNGYISNVRILKGSSAYSATSTTLTIPTAPLTAPINTSLLLNFTNAGIFDNAAENDLETVGNAQISTSVKKYGTGSMRFTAATDYLIPSESLPCAFGSGDFTIEAWIYLNAYPSTYGAVYDARPSGGNGAYAAIYMDTSSIYYYVNTTNAITASLSTIGTGTWRHLAISRSGTSTKMFVDGVQVGSTYTDTTTYLNPAQRPVIGGGGNALGTYPMNGYIDDLRITKGVARYTANFTPPTAAFPDQ